MFFFLASLVCHFVPKQVGDSGPASKELMFFCDYYIIKRGGNTIFSRSLASDDYTHIIGYVRFISKLRIEVMSDSFDSVENYSDSNDLLKICIIVAHTLSTVFKENVGKFIRSSTFIKV